MGPVGIYLGIGSGCIFDIIAYTLILNSYDFNILKIEALGRAAKEVQAIKVLNVKNESIQEKSLTTRDDDNTNLLSPDTAEDS